MSNLFTFTVRNPQQAIALSAESLQIDAAANPGMFQAPHLRLFSIIRSSSEFVTALFEGMNIWRTFYLDSVDV